MKIEFAAALTEPEPTAPHPHYVPTIDFIKRHNLFVDEDDRWVSLNQSEDVLSNRYTIAFNRRYGQISLTKYIEIFKQRVEQTVFCGFLPDEAALETIMEYTRLKQEKP